MFIKHGPFRGVLISKSAWRGRLTRYDSPIQPGDGVVLKRLKEAFKATAELILPAEIVVVLIGLGVEEKPLLEAFRVLVSRVQNLGEPVASQ